LLPYTDEQTIYNVNQSVFKQRFVSRKTTRFDLGSVPVAAELGHARTRPQWNFFLAQGKFWPNAVPDRSI